LQLHLSRRPPALHLCEGRASERHSGPAPVPHRLQPGVESRRSAHPARHDRPARQRAASRRAGGAESAPDHRGRSALVRPHVSATAILLVLLGLGLVAWLSARARAAAFSGGTGTARPHSLPSQHGWYVAMWTLVPALLFLLVWTNLSGGLIYGQ